MTDTNNPFDDQSSTGNSNQGQQGQQDQNQPIDLSSELELDDEMKNLFASTDDANSVVANNSIEETNQVANYDNQENPQESENVIEGFDAVPNLGQGEENKQVEEVEEIVDTKVSENKALENIGDNLGGSNNDGPDESEYLAEFKKRLKEFADRHKKNTKDIDSQIEKHEKEASRLKAKRMNKGKSFEKAVAEIKGMIKAVENGTI